MQLVFSGKCPQRERQVDEGEKHVEDGDHASCCVLDEGKDHKDHSNCKESQSRQRIRRCIFCDHQNKGKEVHEEHHQHAKEEGNEVDIPVLANPDTPGCISVQFGQYQRENEVDAIRDGKVRVLLNDRVPRRSPRKEHAKNVEEQAKVQPGEQAKGIVDCIERMITAHSVVLLH